MKCNAVSKGMEHTQYVAGGSYKFAFAVWCLTETSMKNKTHRSEDHAFAKNPRSLPK